MIWTTADTNRVCKRCTIMCLEMFDKVLLKTGETAYIVEIYEQGVAYEADIDKADGTTETDTIQCTDIEKVLK